MRKFFWFALIVVVLFLLWTVWPRPIRVIQQDTEKNVLSVQNVNSSSGETNSASESEKLSSAPKFEDFPVREVFQGSTAPLDFASDSDAEQFKTALTEAAQGRVNFAGHYILVELGCGTECQNHMMIDALTGKIVSLEQFSGKFLTSRGVQFRLESSLLIADPQLPIGENAVSSQATAPVRYYVLKNDQLQLQLVFIQNCTVENSRQNCSEENAMVFFLSPKVSDIWQVGSKRKIQWQGGQKSLSLFLIDKSLEATGSSVSAGERFYNLPNSGEYEYTVPENLKAGEYKWCIDDGLEYVCSEYFSAVSE